jgi:ribosomal protein L11 methyltransferase
MNYLQFSFQIQSADQSDALVALLSGAGFEGFEEGETLLKAFIPEAGFEQSNLDPILQLVPVPFEKESIAQRNWNEQWEQGFQPVLVDDFAAVRASFHAPVTTVQHEVIITPKMSFGTGHHGTTFLMMQQMAVIDFTGKKVFDFGTGTGVLAILAEKLGAAEVYAIDIDEWSVTNTIENIEANNSTKIHIEQADALPTGETYDIVLANINLNVILNSLQSINSITKPGGNVLLSGFLAADEAQMTTAVLGAGFELRTIQKKEGWLCFHVIRTK